MERWSIGFLFRDNNSEVCLIEKNRPAWQRGRLNGVGGHIEGGESPVEAMAREFREETGASVQWRQFCLIVGSGYELYCFASRDSASVKTMTSEKVSWYRTVDLPPNALPNLRWIIPMASYKYDIIAMVYHDSKEC